MLTKGIFIKNVRTNCGQNFIYVEFYSLKFNTFFLIYDVNVTSKNFITIFFNDFNRSIHYHLDISPIVVISYSLLAIKIY